MSIWSQAKDLAAQTPDDRNRYVDFLRAVSILAVITGHWLIVALYYHDGALIPGDMLAIQPETQWLTWLFQVMPIFFIVGGYANAVSLESARRREIGYAGWLATRLQRLVTPLLALLLGWALLAAILYFAGVSGDVTRLASRAALIPSWFLAIYIMVVVLAPATYRAWQRWGFASFWAFVILGALVDIAFFAAELQWMGWSNY
ncbi:MAG: acyltransferase family protein, partial [Gammaproteobacteria bacterium]